MTPEDLKAEYLQYVEETARDFLRTMKGLSEEEILQRVADVVKWSSWHVSPTRWSTVVGRQVAVPTPNLANIIAQDVLLKMREKTAVAKTHKLRFVTERRWVEYGDIGIGPPFSSEDEPCNFHNKEQAVDYANRFYSFYRSIKIAPPLIEIVSFDEKGKELYNATVEAEE